MLQAVGNLGAVLGTEALASGCVSESKLLHKVSGWSTRNMVLGSAILVQRGHQHLPDRTRCDALLSESLPPVCERGGRVTSPQSNAVNDGGCQLCALNQALEMPPGRWRSTGL